MKHRNEVPYMFRFSLNYRRTKFMVSTQWQKRDSRKCGLIERWPWPLEKRSVLRLDNVNMQCTRPKMICHDSTVVGMSKAMQAPHSPSLVRTAAIRPKGKKRFVTHPFHFHRIYWSHSSHQRRGQGAGEGALSAWFHVEDWVYWVRYRMSMKGVLTHSTLEGIVRRNIMNNTLRLCLRNLIRLGSPSALLLSVIHCPEPQVSHNQAHNWSSIIHQKH